MFLKAECTFIERKHLLNIWGQILHRHSITPLHLPRTRACYLLLGWELQVENGGKRGEKGERWKWSSSMKSQTGLYLLISNQFELHGSGSSSQWHLCSKVMGTEMLKLGMRTWISGRCPCPWHGGGTKWFLRSLLTQTILWFYDSMIWHVNTVRTTNKKLQALKYGFEALSFFSPQCRIFGAVALLRAISHSSKQAGYCKAGAQYICP